MLISNFIINRIQYTADCKVYFPEDAFEQGGQHEHDDEVHNHEQDNDQSVEGTVPPAVVVDYLGPPSLSQQLHHDVLRVNEGPEVGKLDEVVVGSWLDHLFGLVEDLHAQDAEDEEDEGEEEKETSYYWKYLHECLKKTSKFTYNLDVHIFNPFTLEYSSEEKRYPEDPVEYK